MKTILCAVLLLAAFAKADEDNDDWPGYMKKCGKTASNLEECLVDHSNKALDAVMQGDPTIGIPQYNDYFLGEVHFGENRTYKLNMRDSKITGLKHIFVTGFKWNFDQKNVVIKFSFNSAIQLSGRFVSAGTFERLNVKGYGDIDLIFVGGSNGGNLSYTMNYDLLKVLGRDYVQIKDEICTRSEGFRIEFSNKLKTKAEADSDRKFLNEHSDEVNHSISPVIAGIFCRLVNQALNGVFYNFPLDLIFEN